ncbi:MAG: ATP phosphoribosyltransferase regulatory subunit [Nitrospira sp.]|nr:ATP phosphoribosyltransferase regulatory subunit [Candidatus Manganitrophaceae bacterium]HIL35458.1 ATP phosphoribosyltransferase regulatory subunit [Candidatus Manganitrophaceae bacterium]
MKLSGKPKTLIPKGVATFLPEGAARRRAIERVILDLFSQWGYQEVITPLFEYLDVFSLGVGENILDRAYKFVDRATGRIMVLRPDVTPQIARIAATLLGDQPRPLRLCYSANVFRHEEEHAGREREIFQVGGELIGISDVEADAEIISLAIEILKKVGLKSFKVSLGQMAYTRGILQSFRSSPAFFQEVLHSVGKKEVSQLEALLRKGKVGLKKRLQIIALLDLFGGEEVFKKASLLTDYPPCRIALKRLKAVYKILKSAGYQDDLLIDLGEVRGFGYYTGTIFEIFSDGVGSELGGGGRYDQLLEKFGAPTPSTGFALHIERIQKALEFTAGRDRDYSSADFLLLHSPAGAEGASALSRQLRQHGFRVVCKTRLKEGQGWTVEKLASFVSDARRQQIKKILVLENGSARGRIRSVDVRSGVEQKVNLKEVMAQGPPRRV